MKLQLQASSLVQHGARGCLGDVTATAVDASGNVSAPAKSYEVTLKPQATSGNGGASAKVAAKGSNRCRMVQGEAVFTDVQLSTDGQGLFELAASCKSRPVVCYSPTRLRYTDKSVTTSAAEVTRHWFG